MKREIAIKAQKIIDARRLKSENKNKIHFETVAREVPEVAEINRHIYENSRKIIEAGYKPNISKETIEKAKNYNKMASQQIKKILEKKGYGRDYLVTNYYCKLCNDTGYTPNGKRCRCFKIECRKIVADNLNSSVSLKNMTFESFDLAYYKNRKTDSGVDAFLVMQNIYDYCREYYESFDTSKGNILMLGKSGLGKTHLSLSIAGKLIDKGFIVVYNSAINLLDSLSREHFSRDRSEDSILTTLNEIDLLIIDDLGTEMKTDFNKSAIYNIIETRLNRGLATIISSNLSVDGLKKRYEERIVSRLFTMYKVLKFEGEDIRFLKNKR